MSSAKKVSPSVIVGRRGLGKSMGDYDIGQRQPVRIRIDCANALTFSTDVLVLKHAQALYGLDAAVVEKLSEKQVEIASPKQGSVEIVESLGAIAATRVMFVGVCELRRFSYTEIRDFARRSLASLASQDYGITSVAFTIHGPGYGLDENESFDSQLAGLLEAIESGAVPESLTDIHIIELNKNRAKRLDERLSSLLPEDSVVTSRGGTPHYADSLKNAGFGSSSKPHVFVAMPFAKEMDDTFHYGIQGAAYASGFLCERADLSTFTGDVLDWVKARISTAELVVADLSSANPNVYLEVGYAWGCKVPTVLLARNSKELKFDVRGQRCIVYSSIKELEDKLSAELSGLRTRR